MDNTKKLQNVLSLCTGYGGIELGLKRALGKINVLAHVEIEAFAVANLVNKMETGKMGPAPIWTDIKTFNGKLFRGFVDILTGGYPCQPFSQAGNRKGEDDPRHLWPFIKRIIRDCQPRRVFFENVEGHLSLGISEVLKDLEKMGYRSEVGIFSAGEVGAVHERKRVFILADYYGPRASRLIKLNDEMGDSSQGAKTEECLFSVGAQDIKSERWYDLFSKNISGRIPNGLKERLDSFRLLGNGVVPQVAEKAYIVLSEKLNL